MEYSAISDKITTLKYRVHIRVHRSDVFPACTVPCVSIVGRKHFFPVPILMVDCRRFPILDKYLAPFVIHKNAVSTFKVRFAQHVFTEKIKYHSVYKDRLKYFCYIQV